MSLVMKFSSFSPASIAFFLASSLLIVNAQYPPPATNQTIITSPIDSRVSVAYKQPDAGTCMTALSTQEQYTGYVRIPPYTLTPIQQNYSINTWFWFVEARQSPESAPLSIWLNGGPGSSSMFGLFNEVGPCEVVQEPDGTYGTQARQYGFDRFSNMLFIDQPNQVGFSYDVATNASFDLLADSVFEPPTPPNPGLPSYMYLNGTFGTASSDDAVPWSTTANTTQIAAAATWHFLQTWLATFSKYNPAVRPNATTASAGQNAGINLFTESYGGKYAPAFASYFEDKNQAIKNGSLSSSTALGIQIESIGIINGLIDDAIQDATYPLFAYNNTYGTPLISLATEINSLNNFTTQCLPAINACRAAGPDLYGDNEYANELCERALWTCNNITSIVPSAGYDPYDIRQKYPSPDPPAAYQEYLNTAAVLSSIGAAVNYTESNSYVARGFIATGDSIRGGYVQELASLLNMGIRVALIYGDADYLCNWKGGEAISFAIANTASNLTVTSSTPTSTTSTSSTTTATSFANTSLPYAAGFAQAGYAKIVVNSSYVGGDVRQYGNLSFSRVYDAGHFVGFFQPETLSQIFYRVIQGKDLSTATDVNLTTFGSSGPANSTYTNSVPPAPAHTCWVRSWYSSCSQSDTNAMLADQGRVEFGIFVQQSSSLSLPSSSVNAGSPGHPISSSSGSVTTTMPGTALTGAYTATGTPTGKPKKGAAVAVQNPLQDVQSSVGALGAVVLATLFGMRLIV